MTCEHCGGEWVRVGNRGWCVEPYANYGCGAHASGGRIVPALSGPLQGCASVAEFKEHALGCSMARAGYKDPEVVRAE